MDIALLIACLVGEFVACFLLGSIPWGVIVSRLFFNKDIRDEGSGNIGATNAMRSMGKRGGIPVFLLDLAKGLLAGFVGWLFADLISTQFDADYRMALGIAMLACVWGHIFSPWLHFKGGKGISVAFGCAFFSLGPIGALALLVLFIIGVISTRRVSFGSLMGALTFMVVGFICSGPFFGADGFCWVALACYEVAGLTVIWAHRSNIRRIASGEEPRLGASKKEGSK